MTGLPFTADTVFVFEQGSEMITAQPVGALPLGGRTRVVLLDTAERYFVVEVSADRVITDVVAGPVTGADALHAAECVVSGITSHRPVSALVQILAVGLIASTLAQGEGRAA